MTILDRLSHDEKDAVVLCDIITGIIAKIECYSHETLSMVYGAIVSSTFGSDETNVELVTAIAKHISDRIDADSEDV